MEKIPMTASGFRALEDELNRLKNQDRHEMIKAIAEARAHGDLSENAEYHAAKERQSFIEGRVHGTGRPDRPRRCHRHFQIVWRQRQIRRNRYLGGRRYRREASDIRSWAMWNLMHAPDAFRSQAPLPVH